MSIQARLLCFRNEKIFLTQKELSQRWRVSQATIKKMREENSVPFFCVPNTTRVIYPLLGIENIERDENVNFQKEKYRKKEKIEIGSQ